MLALKTHRNRISQWGIRAPGVNAIPLAGLTFVVIENGHVHMM
jgi:hypothetical protein